MFNEKLTWPGLKLYDKAGVKWQQTQVNLIRKLGCKTTEKYWK
jgi:hypothetical protein